MDRPWQLDPVPLLIAPDEAAALTVGLTQRAQLLECLLDDLYGPQESLRNGLLPPELVFDHPGYLRACHGVPVPGGRRLHLYAADLGRPRSGGVWVLADRTQGPSGAGYALENRIVLARMLPDAFRECHVQRLAPFFRTFRDTLRAIAPRNLDNPRIVLLTPGPYNETYFEHAYLARYLGYTLVEGGDLTVRDGCVFLKLLGGLQPVDVILRRLDDDFCDPLELRGHSFLGVPGLVQAVRMGNVAVANALGSGLVETPALMPYLPALSRHFLGEDLILPSPTAWWCGEPKAMDHVLVHMPRMVLKAAYGAGRFEPVFGDRLSAAERQTLADKIRTHPQRYVAQELMPLSTAPVLSNGRLEPRHVVVRVYLAATANTFMVMPGGLTRATGQADSMVVSMQKGGGSKDTWVLSSGPVNTFSLLSPTVQPVELTRGGTDVPSRAADNLYWLGRYAERAEGLVRLLRGILMRLTEKSGLAEVPELPVLLRALTRQTHGYPGFLGEGADARLAAPEHEVLAVIFDNRRPTSLAATLKHLHRSANMSRDRISIDMWRAIGSLDPHDESGNSDGRPKQHNLSDALDRLNRLVAVLAAFGGLSSESMTRGQGWRFLDMGRRLERSLHTTGLLRSTLCTSTGNEGPLLEALLEIADSAMTYRRRYLSSLQTAPVLDLLLADESNPRSVAFQLVALEDHADRLPRAVQITSSSMEQQIVQSARETVRLTNVDQLARTDPTGNRPRLSELLASLEAELPVLSDTLTRHYLTHLLPSRHLSAPSRHWDL
jgi:uncharacterized circularly permuted ATP-grasp superfamily protein/uncharacterized alpha-E superfamily protein